MGREGWRWKGKMEMGGLGEGWRWKGELKIERGWGEDGEGAQGGDGKVISRDGMGMEMGRGYRGKG